MWSTYIVLLSIVSSVGASPTVQSRTENLPSYNVSSTCTTVNSTQDALAFAFTYGYPLYSFSNLVQTNEPIPTNYLIHQRTLRTAEDREIVRPNADTLYSNLFIDLSQVDLELTIPDFGDRYGVWPFYDLYGNNFANIGSVSPFTHGIYLLRYSPSTPGISSSSNTSYAGIINVPTPYGQSIIRIVTDNSTSDLAAVHALQNNLRVRPLPRTTGPAAPPFNLSMFTDPYYRSNNNTSLSTTILRLTAALAPSNPPSDPSEALCVARVLDLAGCSANGIFTQPPNTNLTLAVQAANASVTTLLSAPNSTHDAGNGWVLLDSKLIGDYGTNYAARYFVAGWGYLALGTEQTLYPFSNPSASLTLGPEQALLVTFSRRPVLKATGFWSLTVYGEDFFFVPNALNRYAIGDRSNLTFPDGSAVYGEGAREEDGSFDVLVQAEDVEPPANWTENWLPSQAGGGLVEWNLRCYGAEKEMEAGGGYVYPRVEIVDAIRV